MPDNKERTEEARKTFTFVPEPYPRYQWYDDGIYFIRKLRCSGVTHVNFVLPQFTSQQGDLVLFCTIDDDWCFQIFF